MAARKSSNGAVPEPEHALDNDHPYNGSSGADALASLRSAWRSNGELEVGDQIVRLSN
jgi:hypothetical protein